MHKAEELERRLKFGFIEDSSTAFQDYAEGWLSRQHKYAPSTLASYRPPAGGGLSVHRCYSTMQAASFGH